MSIATKACPLSFRTIPAIYAAGLNYRCHAKEVQLEDKISRYPIFTMKSPTSVVTPHRQTGNETRIVIPTFLQSPPEVDYEGEMAVVIGKRCRDVAPKDALSVIQGITCALDITARRWQGRKGGYQWTYSKGFDTFCPLGPVVYPVSTLEALKEITLTTKLNNEVVQQAKLGEMIFDVGSLIWHASRATTLEVGTVILTGTPAGVGYTKMKIHKDGSVTEKVPRYLQEGDRLSVELDDWGPLQSVVALQPMSEAGPPPPVSPVK